MSLFFTIAFFVLSISLFSGEISLHSSNVSCCEFLRSPEELIKCANGTGYRRLTESHRLRFGPELGLGIVTFATSDIKDYSAYSFGVNEAYASMNGYFSLMIDEISGNYEPKDARWNKVKILIEALNPNTGWARHLDYLVWIDADLIFLDFSLRLEQMTLIYPSAHIFVSAEHAGSSTLINSGCVLVRNSAWTLQFLSDWWNFADRRLHSDQEQFDMLYHATKTQRNLEKYIAILPPDALNSDPPAMTKQKPNNQVLHLMGEHSSFRIRVFKTALQQVCSDLNKTLSSNPNAFQLQHRPQLGITQENLLKWTIEEYSKESKTLFEAFEKLAESGKNGLSQARKLANSIHHYAHALEHRQNKNDFEFASNLRIRSFEILYINLQQKRQENEESRRLTGKMLEDWPEMIKNVAEAGQNIIQLGDVSQRMNVARAVMQLLEELLHSCHKIQQKAVLAMIAHTHSETGLIHLNDNKLDEAVKHFQISVNISKDLSEISGEHILVNPMSYLANALSMKGQFLLSLPIYEKILKISENNLGVNHESLAQILVNYGIALVQSGKYLIGKDALRRALRIMRLNKEPKTSTMYIRAREYLEKANNEDGEF